MKLPPFIVTLGTWQIVLAINFLYSANETIRSQDIDRKGAARWQFFGAAMHASAASRCCSASSPCWSLLVCAPGLRAPPHRLGPPCLCGRRRSGSGELAGVQSRRVLIQVYALAGLICALAGWVLIGRFGSVSPPPRRRARQHRIDHRRGDRRHLAVRRPRLDPRHDVRRADRRRVLAGAAPWSAPIRNGPIC